MRKILIVMAFLSLTLLISGCASEPQANQVEPVQTEAQPDATPTPSVTPSPTAEPKPDYLVMEGDPQKNYVAPFPVGISLDGDLSDWEGVPLVSMGNPESTEITFAIASDGDYIYFLADVIDSVIISGEHGDQYWNEDSVEFYLNGTGDLELAGYIDGVTQITVPPLNIGKDFDETAIGGVRGNTVDAQVIVVKTDQGYAIELSVPVENDVWSIPVVHNYSIGFNVKLNSSNQGGREMIMDWSAADQSDSSYYNPSVFGQLIFAEIGNQTPVGPQPTPTPKPTLTPLPPDSIYLDPDAPVEDRIENLVQEMSLEEKIGQMTLIEKNSLPLEDVGPFGIGGVLSGGGGSPETNTPAAWAEMVDEFQNAALNSRLGIPVIY
ncbi:MAG: hypothetical protein GWN14_17775, partial [candidate division Zixibacteria bacterium]|nr:hypothetical protein [Gammaproteobacteria bacterium]NIX57717.1 hypothetical protein [candidate division Zixibacteria bacterium]